MRYVTPIVEYVSHSKTKSGDYYNYYLHVKDGDGYLSKLTMTQDAYDRLDALSPSIGDSVYCGVVSFDKKYKRKSDGSSFWMHRELVTVCRLLADGDYLGQALAEGTPTLFPKQD